jgi:hypothetical protein
VGYRGRNLVKNEVARKQNRVASHVCNEHMVEL